MITIMTAIMLMLVVRLPAGNVNTKKHTECFNAGVTDGKDHPFDASRFDRCGKNYQDGFLKGCKDAGNNEDTCQSAEDNQD
jgi:hypothetical protein